VKCLLFYKLLGYPKHPIFLHTRAQRAHAIKIFRFLGCLFYKFLGLFKAFKIHLIEMRLWICNGKDEFFILIIFHCIIFIFLEKFLCHFLFKKRIMIIRLKKLLKKTIVLKIYEAYSFENQLKNNNWKSKTLNVSLKFSILNNRKNSKKMQNP
jgi:hypothetical protein